MSNQKKSTFAERLKQLMKNKNMSQAELSRLSGIRASSISDWLNEKYEAKQDKIDVISRALNVSPSYLMGYDVDPAPLDNVELLGQVNSMGRYPFIENPVAAGTPFDIEGTKNYQNLDVPDYILGKYAHNNNIFFMRINGESMNKIIPNDSLIAVMVGVEIQDLKQGDIVVFRTSAYEYSVKQYFLNGDYIIFKPMSTDPNYKDIIYSIDDNIEIIGKVILYSVIL